MACLGTCGLTEPLLWDKVLQAGEEVPLGDVGWGEMR